TDHFRPQFEAIRDGGRPVRVDLRYKGLRAETTRAAIDMGLDVTVSTKFWCEHLGLPYHPTVEDTHYRESRYGYGAMLRHAREYRVAYRLWTVGSHRLLLWADPEYAARFARSCRLGGGEGFEIFAPLTNKGYGNAPGRWRIFADPSYESYQWEQQRYWLYYLVFGRLGYDPRADPAVWRRELRRRFGRSAADVEQAYCSGSRVIPLVTAARSPSASEWRWWPEIDTGDGLDEYMHTAPGDTGQFYAIRTWKRTPRWRCEEWDDFPPGYVEDAVSGRLTARWTPIQVSAELQRLARETLAAADRAEQRAAGPHDSELRATCLDMRTHAHLAEYHAEKTLAATHLAFFEVTGDTGRLSPALRHVRRTAAAWEQIVQITEGVYHDDLVFGHSESSKRSTHGHHHVGHWRDRLDEVLADVAHLEALLEKHGGESQLLRTYPGEGPPAKLPRVEHTPIDRAVPGADLSISARVVGRRRPRQVRLHYRPLDQTMDWRRTEMLSADGQQFEGTISGDDIEPGWDLMYYIEVLVDGGGLLWPSWRRGQPYIVVTNDGATPGGGS
ncbi:MAG: hypothetical protein ACE5JM_15200, partial [Armatimonadota bacterium]